MCENQGANWMSKYLPPVSLIIWSYKSRKQYFCTNCSATNDIIILLCFDIFLLALKIYCRSAEDFGVKIENITLHRIHSGISVMGTKTMLSAIMKCIQYKKKSISLQLSLLFHVFRLKRFGEAKTLSLVRNEAKINCDICWSCEIALPPQNERKKCWSNLVFSLWPKSLARTKRSKGNTNKKKLPSHERKWNVDA